MKGRILTYVLVCLALATTACISPGGSDDPTTKPNHLNSNPFPIAGDISLDSQPNLTKDATVNEDTALLEHDGAVQETVGPEDSSPYECEPFT